jgi:hypothetical protein
MNKNIPIILATILLFMSACTKELSTNTNTFTPYQGNAFNDTTWLKNITGISPITSLADTLAQNTLFTDSIDLWKDKAMVFGDSLEIDFKGGSCSNNAGIPQDGKARIDIIRLQKKGDFIKAYRPNTSFMYLLEAGSAFFIRITKNGSELALAPGASIKIKYADIEEAENNMQVFYGKETMPFPTSTFDPANTWVRSLDTSYIKTWTTQTNSGIKKGYELEAKSLRWISAHRALDPNPAKTNIYAILPPNFTNKNTVVFAVFNNNRTVIDMHGDYASRSFTTSNIPLKTKLLLVSISKFGPDLYLGTRLVNDVGTMVNYSFTPEKKSLTQILAFLNSL